MLLLTLLTFLSPVTGLAQETKLVTDFTKDLPAETYPDATVVLRMHGIRQIPNVAEPGDVFVSLTRTNGTFPDAGHTAAADYNQKSGNAVRIDSLAIDGTTLRGRIHVTIGADAPRPGGKGFPVPQDEYEIDIDAKIDFSATIDHQPEATPFMPPWRRDEPQACGRVIKGTYVAKRSGVETRGDVLGAIQAKPAGARIGMRGNLSVEPDPAGGAKVLARMSPVRVASDQAMLIKPLTGVDASAYDAVRITISSDKRRDDVSVMVAIEAAGQWRQITSGAFLRAGEKTYDIPFDDFGRFDSSKLTAVGIGVDNPHGVGDVSFSVRKIELVRLGLQRAAPKREVKITLDPDVVVSLNGTMEVPKGLFGFHDVGSPKDESRDPVGYMKKINPGYLRPLEHVGFNAKPLTDEQIAERAAQKFGQPETVFSRRAAAANATDEVIMTHTTDLWNRPPWMDSGVEKAAEGVRAFYRERASRAWRPGDDANWLRRFEVWNEPFMWARHTNMGKLNPAGRKAWTDPTQFGYLPGRMNADVYATLFLAAVEGAKSANPHVQLGGPSTAEVHGDDFATLSNYVGPILDRVHDKIDFITEHHYGGDPRTFAASYQVLKAWCDTKYGRRIPVYNTECNDLGASSAGKARYNMLDILTCINQVRDVAKGRAVHALWNGFPNDTGERHCFELLSTLRGPVLLAGGDDADVTTVASHPKAGEVVVVALNHGPVSKRVALDVPQGFVVDEAMVMLADAPEQELQLKDTEGQAIPSPSAGSTSLGTLADKPASVDLPRGSAIRWTLRKDGYTPQTTRVLEESFVDTVLAEVKAEAALRAPIKWKSPAEGRKRAYLRLVTRDVHRGEAVAVIGDSTIPLPYSTSNAGQPLVQDVPIDPAILRGTTEVTFRCVDPAASNGFAVHAASILIQR